MRKKTSANLNNGFVEGTLSGWHPRLLMLLIFKQIRGQKIQENHENIWWQLAQLPSRWAQPVGSCWLNPPRSLHWAGAPWGGTIHGQMRKAQTNMTRMFTELAVRGILWFMMANVSPSCITGCKTKCKESSSRNIHGNFVQPSWQSVNMFRTRLLCQNVDVLAAFLSM